MAANIELANVVRINKTIILASAPENLIWGNP